MIRKKRIWAPLLFLTFLASSYTQEIIYYLNEDFEDTDNRALWTSYPPDAIIFWDFQDGGGNDLPPSNYDQDGSYNAYFSWYNFAAPEVRTLISPPIDLTSASLPQLNFAHAQHYQLSYQDELYLLFRAGGAADWDTIEHYSGHVYPWSEHFFNINEFGTKYFVEDFQLGFMAVGKGGNGVCIDSITIEEKDIIPKYVRNFSAGQVGHSLLPTQVDDLAVLQVYIEVFGNVDTLKLNSINFTSTGSSDTDFPAGAFSIYHTRNEIFQNNDEGVSNKIGASVSINSGVVSFSGLDYVLSTGDNYLWLTADIDANAVHGDTVDFQLLSNSISVSDTTFPSVTVSPAGFGIINESVLFDNFESSSGWTLQGDFEVDTPQGFPVNISKDPDFAFSGMKILGTDLRADGGYTPGIIPSTAYYAVTPTVNLKYYKNVKLFAQKWLSFNYDDETTIEVSIDGGSSWDVIWDRKVDFITGLAENGWSEFLIEDKLNKFAATQGNVVLRLAMNETHESYTLGGWNLDDFAIVGNHLETDVGITEIYSPYDDCIGTFNDSVKIIVRNYAEGPTPPKIPIYYSQYGFGGTRVYDTIDGPIAQDDSVIFIFEQTVNFPGPGSYDFIVSTDLTGDEDLTNDTISADIFLQNNIVIPYTEDFETGKGYWLRSKESIWDCVVPGGGVPILSESPNSWFVAPTSVYLNSDTSWIESSCYDLVSPDVLVLELKYWNESEAGTDGANIQYSSNDGQTWSTITNTAFGDYSNWYSSAVSAIGDIGWSGNTVDWITAREFVPAILQTEPNVKFRVYWASNETTATGRGIAIDDFSIFRAPPDIGVSSFLTPVDACQFVNDGRVELYVKNYGVNNMYAGDSVIVGVNLDANIPVFDTIVLGTTIAPGDSLLLTVEASLDLSEAKSYSLYAYTLVEDDPQFYSLNSNDTAYHSFTVWPNPVTELPDTVSSREPKTLVLRTYDTVPPGYTFLWFDGSTADTHTVSQSDVYYKVEVTEPEHACKTEDSVYVLLLFNDVGVDSVISPVSSCELDNQELVQVQLRNHGTDSLFLNDEIVLYYQVNGGMVYRDTIILDSPLVSNGTILHSFDNELYDFSQVSNYEIKSWAFFAGDTVKSNDSTSKFVDVYGYPVANLGSDKSINALEYTLDAGPGFASYLWNTGDTVQSILVNNSGYYWVRVENEYGCPDYDTVNIWFSIRDIIAFNLFRPAHGCYNGQQELVSVSVLNNGTDTITASDAIEINYVLNSGSVVTDTHNLSTAIIPGQYGVLNFSVMPILPLDTSIFEVWVKIPGDLRADNDSLTAFVVRATSPVVDLGEDRVITNNQEILDAGPGASYTYLWQDSSTSRTFIATETAEYYCTVTDQSTNCSGSDTVLLDFDFTDFAIYSYDVGNTVCQGLIGNVNVRVLNNSSKIKTDQKLTIGFNVNSSDTIMEDFSVNGFWFPKEQKELTLSNRIDLSTSGINVVNVFFVGLVDLNFSNDQLSKSVNVQLKPVINFGGDTIQVSFPHTLDPGGGFTSYQWQDNSTDRYFEVLFTGLYSVTVTNAFNCSSTQKVYVEPVSFDKEYYAHILDVICYPNPANSVLSVKASFKGVSEVKFELIDLHSRVLWSDKQMVLMYHNDIDISKLSKGIYYLKAVSEEGYWIGKVIIE